MSDQRLDPAAGAEADRTDGLDREEFGTESGGRADPADRRGGLAGGGSGAGFGVGPASGLRPGLLGLPGSDERLLAVIAAAAPFPDRVAADVFAPQRAGGRRQVADRSARWLRAAVGDDETATRALFRHRQRSGRDLGAGLLDVAVRDPGRLPDWAYALIDFLLAQPATRAEDPATGLVGAPFAAFHRAMRRLIDCRDHRIRGVRLTESAFEDVAGQLIERLTQACSAAFDFEQRIMAPDRAAAGGWLYSVGLDVSRAGWLDRLESLPVLGYVIGIVCLQWQRAVRELFDRLHDDLPLLRRTLWRWADPGALDGYSGDSGDLHDHGRAVTVLTFAGGQRLVYKPKDLSSAAGFMDLVTFLNHHGLPQPLATRQIILREKYGWEEYVASTPCPDPDGAGRYYTAFGMLTRLAEFLECRDFWADNLIAIGDAPMFIDLENVLQGRIRQPVMLGERIGALWAEVEDTVAKTAAISYPRLIGTAQRAQDLGCMASLQEAREERPDAFPAGWEPPPYRPTCDGRLADPRDHTAEVVAGYRVMHGCLAANRDALADPAGPLVLLRGAAVRYLWRNTFDCLDLLGHSVGPLALVHGTARETMLAKVMRSVRELLSQDAAREDALEIAEQEIEAFRRMDVPFFLARTDSSSVFTPDGVEIPDHFEGTAWDRLQARIAALDTFALEEHVAVLESCLDLARQGRPVRDLAAEDADRAPARRRTPAVYRPGRADPTVPPDQLVDQACAIADEVLAAVHRSRGEYAGWLGLVQYPAHGLGQIEPLSGDLLSGTSGLAVFFAELYQSTGRPAYWTALHDALDGAVEFAALAQDSAVYRRMSGRAAPVGAFVGLGSVLYALSHCGAVLGEAPLVRRAAGLLPLARRGLGARTPADVVLGRAGLLLAVHRLRAASSEALAEADEFAAELHDDLLARSAEGLLAVRGPHALAAPYPDRVAVLDGLPAGPDGIAYALARSSHALGRLGVPGDHPFRLDTPGSIAAALAAAHHLGRPAPAEALRALRERLDRSGALTCEQLLVTADVAVWADALTAGEPALREAAHEAMRTLMGRRERTGSWFGDRLLADRLNLSALNGLPAVGLLCLRLADPDAVSPRLAL